ncbi:RluA family pseudouridine synthase [Geobacillus sp. G4]|uniref:Pseudouridine synthase n=6 Tax=Geobacillus TaxID=129337 RepID=Q5L1R4_GEOKA|nr:MULTISPECIES: RluA family pseudouridine synthase [Geobacillus]KDE48773.1 pseudouridine synthase [Geobacillus sp. CAMR12739]AEV18307.1 Pseudouridine synthase [Geobacillus thermoleovorans CCB_US3_UF5]AMV10119.1 RNA pseudouridine synthase [Geobacillus thermoleovorans]AOL33712.1 RNA pseudouridine synthase [Geobacillus thermoleovorans]AWO73619.1 RluA family pseudouridine synthase [Geobacillus thermoleovorans]
MPPFTMTFSIDEQHDGKLLRQFLQENGISRTALTDIKFHGGALLVDGRPVTVRHVLRAGETLSVVFPPERTSDWMDAEAMPLDILYEDDYVLVVNKPAGLATIPSRHHPGGTLANGLLHHYRKQQLDSTVHIVTRLDRDTSGLVLVAKHRHVHHLLSALQQKGHVVRTYEAICHGVIVEDEGTIDAPIGRQSDSIIAREVREDGKPAVTHFRVLERLYGYTYVSLRLETGRTHQIRVHLAYLGHPLAGDELYGGSREMIGRQALHSRQLSFFHPFAGRWYTCSAPLPDDMELLIEATRRRCAD